MGLDMWLTGYPRKEKPSYENCAELAYWRKANAIHKWFVDRVQGGIDDCKRHREVTREDLEDLADVCEQVLKNVVLVAAKVTNGYRLNDIGGRELIIEDGQIVLNQELCKWLLPTQDGFFFGETEYDHWYIEDVRYTYETVNQILDSWDFKNGVIYYQSSW